VIMNGGRDSSPPKALNNHRPMKKFLILILLVFGVVWFYFWYVRGVNILLRDAEEVYLPPYTSFAVRLQSGGAEDQQFSDIWSSAVAMPTPRTDVGAANVGDIIYVAGGIDSFARVKDTVEAFDTSKNSWMTVAPLPQPLFNLALVTFDGKLYAIGGFDKLSQTPVDTVYVFNAEVGSWETKAPLPNAVGGAAAVVSDGKIHVLGGRLGTGIGDIHLIYDAENDGWSYGEGLMGPRAFHGAAALEGRIIVFGGRSGSLAENMRTVDELVDRASNWESIGFMNSRRSSFGTVVFGGKVYAFGGETTTAAMDSAEIFDPASNTWTDLTPMPTGRHGVGAAAVGGRIFVIGGGRHAGISVSDANEVFLPAAEFAEKEGE